MIAVPTTIAVNSFAVFLSFIKFLRIFKFSAEFEFNKKRWGLQGAIKSEVHFKRNAPRF